MLFNWTKTRQNAQIFKEILFFQVTYNTKTNKQLILTMKACYKKDKQSFQPAVFLIQDNNSLDGTSLTIKTLPQVWASVEFQDGTVTCLHLQAVMHSLLQLTSCQETNSSAHLYKQSKQHRMCSISQLDLHSLKALYRSVRKQHGHTLCLQQYSENPLASLRRRVYMWALIGWANVLVSGWQEVNSWHRYWNFFFFF